MNIFMELIQCRKHRHFIPVYRCDNAIMNMDFLIVRTSPIGSIVMMYNHCGSYGYAISLNEFLVYSSSPVDVRFVTIFKKGTHSRALPTGMAHISAESTATGGGLAGGSRSLVFSCFFSLYNSVVCFLTMYIPLAP